ncbi:hypothetical protein ES703_70027 [subsurface metagenome]
MYQEEHLPQILNAHHPGGIAVVKLIHHRHLQEVVARAQRPQLRQPPLLSLSADLVGSGSLHAARLLGGDNILGQAVAPFHRPAAAHHHNLVQLLPAGSYLALRAQPGRDVVEKLVDQRLYPGSYLLLGKISPHQPDAAVNIETDAPRRYHPVFNPGRRHPTDGEAVAPVNIGHRQRVADNAGQKSHVGYLLKRVLLKDVVEHGLAGKDATGHRHALLIAGRYLPAVVIYLFDYFSPA